MADLVRLAHYPFLPQVREAVREAGVGPEDLFGSVVHRTARERAVARVLGAMGEGFGPAAVTDERSALQELLSVAAARMLCVAVGDRMLARRYADAEARHLEARLGDDPAAVPEMAEALGVPLRAEGEWWTLDVPSYLQTAPVQQAEWKLLLRPVRSGRVWLDGDDARGLCVEALRRRIREEVEAELGRPLPDDLRQALEPLVVRITPELEEARERWNTGDFGPIQPGLFPPCMKELFALMERGQNVPHHGRFAFASFMGTIGMTAEQVMDYLSATPNFDREKSRYQIEHITGERGVEAYTPPGCQSMQTNGICPLDKRDGLCAKIRHPLSYYRAKIRFQEEDKQKAAAILEADRLAGRGGGQGSGGAAQATKAEDAAGRRPPMTRRAS